jgi:hypothetical protein
VMISRSLSRFARVLFFFKLPLFEATSHWKVLSLRESNQQLSPLPI